MLLTVFYSWQTDTSARVNRNFIEEALRRALKQINANADVVNAVRSAELRLDKDTMGFPGTPPIVDTIFKKIDGCSVFVPDLTFVARTDAGRSVPNANVMLEYGWALKSRGHERIVAVMNEAFGAPTGENLPFNIRHVRWPIRYTLRDDFETGVRTAARKRLVDELARGIATVLDSVRSEPEVAFQQTPNTYDDAVFFGPNEKLAIRPGRMDEECYVPQGPKMFLRLIPTVPNPEITPKQALDKAREGRLQPFTLSIINGGEWYERNRFGAIVYRTAPDAPAIEHLTQLFKNSELWGLSTELEQTRRELGHGVLLSGYEHAFLRALDNYLDFSLDHLQLRLPLRLVAGITGIEGFRMAAPPGMRFGGWERWGGRAVEPHVTFSVTVSDRKTPRIDMLMPFFEMVWEAFGLERPNTSG